MSAVDRIWYGDSLAAQLARASLTPASIAYGGVVRLRAALYDHGWLHSHAPALPVLSLGNLSVGGTGKTPIAAWAAAELRRLGAHPAVLLRGYGNDEPLVHGELNHRVPVVVNADRVAGVEQAVAAGADCVILDDGFQHRRLGRQVDWVLVAAEQYEKSARLLPAGPLREPARALARAHVVIVTRKTASLALAESIADRLATPSHRSASAICELVPDAVVDAVHRQRHPLTTLRDKRVVAVAAIGTPAPFFAQLRDAGVTTVREIALRDHHRYGPSDVDRFLRAAHGADAVVCTLKDAVKLAPQWRHDAPPLWYVSQRVEIARGRATLDTSLATLLSARAGAGHTSTAGSAG